MQSRPTLLGEPRRLSRALLFALALIAVAPGAVFAAPSVDGAGALAAAPSSSGAAHSSATVEGRSAPAMASAAVPATFTYDLYRPGIYSTQATWWYCTAASVQIMRNIDERAADHSATNQTHYFTFMRAHNAHRMPATDGIDPKGFLAGLRGFVDRRYALVASTTFENAVRSGVMRLRRSELPVALIVDRGRHAWVLTGFTATADPARTSSFRVLTVRVTGPLYGRQSRNGYDSRPDTGLSVDAFRRFLTPYDFKYGPTAWDDRFVTFQAIP